uniref:ABC transporter permease n=1 Tax=Algoriphagus sp. TaxID=1872435 RepID=UPI004048738A
MENLQENWDIEINSNKSWFDLQLKEIWRYRDLLLLFVRRDIVSFYKQTVLGPLWYFIQPIFTTIVFTFVFGNLAGLSTGGLPQPLFYLSGITAWNYFSDCLLKTSTIFRDNQGIFGKVYFPRVISPLSIVISNLLKFGIQMLLFLILVSYYLLQKENIVIGWEISLFPIFVLFMAMQGLGIGMIITSLTTKYRDLVYLVSFGIQLMMYAAPVIYPLSSLSGKMYWIVALNPMSFVIEGMRKSILGEGILTFETFFYTFSISLIILFLGLIIFNKTQKDFIDTI